MRYSEVLTEYLLTFQLISISGQDSHLLEIFLSLYIFISRYFYLWSSCSPPRDRSPDSLLSHRSCKNILVNQVGFIWGRNLKISSELHITVDHILRAKQDHIRNSELHTFSFFCCLGLQRMRVCPGKFKQGTPQSSSPP